MLPRLLSRAKFETRDRAGLATAAATSPREDNIREAFIAKELVGRWNVDLFKYLGSRTAG